jgi:Flp pilus assembly protein TadG
MIDCLRKFVADQRGNVSMMFGLALMPMLAAAGAAIDYTRASSSKSIVNAAADAGALGAAAKNGTAAEREAVARSIFASNLQRAGYPYPVSVRYTNLVEQNINRGYRVEVTSAVPTLFGWVVGSASTNLAATSEARSGSDEATELAFVLDTTDSMEGDRIVNLKSAVNTMLDDMTSRSTMPNSLKVGVVPFAQYVNVGMANRNAPWINVPADYQTPVVTTCRDEYDVVGTTNCRNVSYPAEPFVPPGTCMRDGRPRPCGGSPGRPARTENVCDPVYATTPVNRCYTSGGDWVRWQGCVGSRNYPLNTRDSDYGTRIPGLMGISCGTPIQNLTTDITSVRSTVNALVTTGETYLPSGLIWGKRMLSPGEPLASSSSPSTRKILVLVTDGRNTKSPTYPLHDGGDEAQANQMTRETCMNIANDTSNPIRVFTVAFEMDGLDTKAILSDCARASNGRFFDAQDATALRAAFSDIANAIYGVKLTQ